MNFVILTDCVLSVKSPFFLMKKCVTLQMLQLSYMKTHEDGEQSLTGNLTFLLDHKIIAHIAFAHFQTVLINSSDCICN